MLHVRNFLRLVKWTGEVPGHGQVPAQAANNAMGRAARVLVENIADLLPSRGWEAGVRDFEKSKLSGRKYAPSSVRSVLRTLRRAGLITTRRTRDGRTGLEGYSTVHLSPRLVDLARRWQALRLELKLKSVTTDRKKAIDTEIQLMQNVNLPFLYDHPGNPHEQGLAANPLLNLSTHRCSKLATPYTGIHAPPPSGGGGGGLVPDSLAPALEAGAPGPLAPPPLLPQGRGGVGVGHENQEKENLDEENPVVGAENEEPGRGSDVVRKNFEFWRGKRLEFSAKRQERHQAAGATGTVRPPRPPWRPDGRPRLQEWYEDDAPARHDGPGSMVLIQGDQSAFFEIRAFAAALDAFHEYQPGHTTLSLIQPNERGRIPIFAKTSFTKTIDEDGKAKTKKMCGTDGLWCDLDWQKVFHFAWAKSQKLFEQDGSGEQIFAAPGEKSRMILIDDLKTPVPVFEEKLCIILETSGGNYQHLYCSDRELAGEERHHIQKVLAARFGGDPGATGGAQPHRVPGSTNYKKGRNLFVCRLVGTVSFMDGGKPLEVDKILRETPAEAPADRLQQMEQHACKKVAPRARGIIVPPGGGGGDASGSGQDWRNSIVKAAALKAAGMYEFDVRVCVEKMLLESAQLRGKNDVNYYVSRTMMKLSEAGHL